MSKKLTSLSQFDSLAAGASQDATKKAAEVASATGDAIRELYENFYQATHSITIVEAYADPNDNVYWFYIQDSENDTIFGDDIEIYPRKTEPDDHLYWLALSDTEEE